MCDSMASSMSKLLSKVVDSLTSIDLQADAVREHFKAQVIDVRVLLHSVGVWHVAAGACRSECALQGDLGPA